MGWSNADNKFGPTPYIVGETLGDGVNYTSIQAAINDAGLAGGGMVLVRYKASGYIEDIALEPDVDVIGVESSSSGSSSGGAIYSRVLIQGQITAPIGGDCRIENLFVVDNGLFCVEMTGGGGIFAQNCSFTSSNQPCFHIVNSDIRMNCCNVNNSNTSAFFYDVGAGGSVRMFDTRVDAQNYCFDFQNVGTLFCDSCVLVSSGSGVVFDNFGANIQISRSQMVSSGAAVIDMQFAGGTCTLSYNLIQSAIQGINFNAVGPVVRSYQNSYVIAAGSEYVVGPGTYEYGSDVVNPVTAQGIDNATTQVKYAWRPWAESVAAPGLFSTKGTCSFDSAHFAVTDGFTQLLGGPTGIVWTDYAVSTAITAFSGSNATAALTFTLPTAPANGSVCDFLCSTAGAVVLQAGAGDFIRIGSTLSAVTGTATSTAIGDSVHLVYMDSSNTWASVGGPQGNWTVV